MGAITKTSIPLTNALDSTSSSTIGRYHDATVCSSNRVPVTVDVANSIGEISSISNINVFPVPTNDIQISNSKQ